LVKVLFDIAQQMWRQRESTNARFSLRRAHLAAASDIVDAALDGDCAVQEVEVSPL
jgi:DNA-binding protein YbaB